jgi:hypothetical protein
MSGHLGLREEARSGALLAAQIARLFLASRLNSAADHSQENLLMGKARARRKVLKSGA